VDLIPESRLEAIEQFPTTCAAMSITEQRELVRGYRAHLHSTEPARCLMRHDQDGTLREVMDYIAASGVPDDARFPIMDAIGVYLREPWALANKTAPEHLSDTDKEIALAQACELASYVERQAKGAMVEAARRFLSLPYAQQVAARLARAAEIATQETPA
jgi:hypothetical protein